MTEERKIIGVTEVGLAAVLAASQFKTRMERLDRSKLGNLYRIIEQRDELFSEIGDALEDAAKIYNSAKALFEELSIYRAPIGDERVTAVKANYPARTWDFEVEPENFTSDQLDFLVHPDVVDSRLVLTGSTLMRVNPRLSARDWRGCDCSPCDNSGSDQYARKVLPTYEKAAGVKATPGDSYAWYKLKFRDGGQIQIGFHVSHLTE